MIRRIGSMIVGLFLLAWGLSLLGVPAFAQVGDFMAWLSRLWPLILIAWGAHRAYHGLLGPPQRRGHGLVFGLAVLGLGAVLLADNIGLTAGGAWSPFAGLLVGAGLGFLLRAVVRP